MQIDISCHGERLYELKQYSSLAITFVHSRVFVLNHRQLVDLAKLLEDGLQVLLLQVSGYLPDEELDCVRLLHWEV